MWYGIPYVPGMDEVSPERAEAARRLRALRDAKGLSLSAAAERANVKRSTWQGWEGGEYPSAPMAVRAAQSLDTTVEAIWGDGPLPADLDVATDPHPSQAPEAVRGAA